MSNDSTLKRIYINASRSDIAALADPLWDTMSRYRIGSPLERAHFLAQVGHETGELRWLEELASGQAYEGRRDLGNTQPGDGRRFKGRGAIHCTGRANYTEYDRFKKLGGRLLRDPSLLATDMTLAADVAGWYWITRQLGPLALDDNLEAVTRKINGGLNGLRDRRRLLDIAKSVLGAGRGGRQEGLSTYELQAMLNRVMGEDLSLDGIYGPATRGAVLRFQIKEALTADGRVNTKTIDRLRELADRLSD